MHYKTAEIYFHLVLYQFTARLTYVSYFFSMNVLLLQQNRIDSGFFLFQAEMKKKQEKKKKKIMTTRNRADSSDDEFMWLIRFHCWHTISSYGMKSYCFIFIPWCIIKKAHRLILITGGSSILLAPVGSTVIRDQTVYTQKCIRPWNQNKFFFTNP